MIKNRRWHGKHGPVLIAEIGGNHEGDFEYAKELARLAIATPADFVKFQLYTAGGLVSPRESPDRHQHFGRFELSQEQHVELAQMCLNGGKKYLASVWDMQMLDWIDPYLDVYKIGSGDLTAYPVLRTFAERGKPIILSTGLATFEEVADAVGFLRNCNPIYNLPEYLAILQCTSMYPIEHADARLRVMEVYRERLGVSAGYSDHTTDSIALEAAVALGAEVLEFHFTDTREGKEFRDHKVSLTPAEVVDLAARTEKILQVIGTPEKSPLECETSTGHVTSFRRAAYLKRDVQPGEVIGEEDIVCLRPNHGVDARLAADLIGKRAKEPIRAYEGIQEEQLDPDDQLAG